MTSQTLSLDPAHTVGELVTQNPGRSRIFEQHGIDYCCGGKIPLTDACEKKSLDLDRVLCDLRQIDENRDQTNEVDAASMKLSDLIDHIISVHHDFLRTELPRLGAMLERVVTVHGQNHPWVAPLFQTYRSMAMELSSHMMKEEQILFPIIRIIEDGESESPGRQAIQGPIDVMEREHDEAGDALKQMRTLSNNYSPPEGACNTFRAVLDGLAELEEDLHRHIHKENNVLFPRAIEMAGD